MTKHPDVFMTSQQFKQALIDAGCGEGYADAATSDFSILMPLLIHALGKERFFEIVEQARPGILLEPAIDAWKASTKHITAWADKEIKDFVKRKNAELQRKAQKGKTQ